MDRGKMMLTLGAGVAIGVVLTTCILSMFRNSFLTSSTEKTQEPQEPTKTSSLLSNGKLINRFKKKPPSPIKASLTDENSKNFDTFHEKSIDKSIDEKLCHKREHKVRVQVNRYTNNDELSQEYCSIFHTPDTLNSSQDNVGFLYNTIPQAVIGRMNKSHGDDDDDDDNNNNCINKTPKKPPRRHPPKKNIIVNADVHREQTANSSTTSIYNKSPNGHSTLNEISSKNSGISRPSSANIISISGQSSQTGLTRNSEEQEIINKRNDILLADTPVPTIQNIQLSSRVSSGINSENNKKIIENDIDIDIDIMREQNSPLDLSAKSKSNKCDNNFESSSSTNQNNESNKSLWSTFFRTNTDNIYSLSKNEIKTSSPCPRGKETLAKKFSKLVNLNNIKTHKVKLKNQIDDLTITEKFISLPENSDNSEK
ncbi:hypothetical protein HCN44_009877 [Aphidius gifuensis]|uniref:Uncharacterized protein n=1 Tax=Aphidius gifuensis TaxID=684658 RepID=A0A834XR36_APHGI|nr:hypothetical protein HCN44_009877 [Aphidius gifuensis]